MYPRTLLIRSKYRFDCLYLFSFQEKQMHAYPLYAALRKHLFAWYTRLHNGIALMGWVMLGLGLIALLVEMLASFPGWLGPILFGPKIDMIFVQKGDITLTSTS